MTVQDRHFYEIPDGVEVPGLTGKSLIVDSHWQMNDQTQDRVPEGLELRLTDPGGPPGHGDVLLPTKTESKYVLYPRSLEDERRFAAAAVSDVNLFVSETFVVLEKYYEFYNRAAVA